MNDYEMLVAQHLHRLEKLLEESFEWQAALEKQPDRARHNQWADEHQARFQDHLQAARAGLQTSITWKVHPKEKSPRVEAWTAAAVGGDVDYRLETDHSRSRVGPVFAGRVAPRLRELEQCWDSQLERLYRLSRR